MPPATKNQFSTYKRYYHAIESELGKPVARAYMTVSFSLLTISLFGWYAIRPTVQTILTLRREIIDKTAVNIQMENKIAALIEAQAIYQDIQTDLPFLDQALPTAPDALRGVAYQLQRLGQDTHVDVTTMSFATLPIIPQATAASKLVSFPVSMSLSGGFKEVKSFLQGVLDLRRIMRIDSLTFTPQRSNQSTASPSATTSGSQLKLDLQLTVFYLSG